MQSTEHSTKRVNRGFYFGCIVMPLLLGFIPFLRVLDSNSQAIRALDMVRLIGAGSCLGIAFAGLLWLLPKFRKAMGGSTTPSRRVVFGQIITPLLLGVLGLLRVLGDSNSQAIRGLDIVRLTGAGFNWGLAFAALLWLIVPKFRER